jgi:DNA-binding transcriptional LysR family regulator
MARAGVGVTVLPRLSRSQSGPDLKFIAVANPSAFRVLGVVRKAGRSLTPAAQRLVACVLEIIAERAAILAYDPTPADAAWEHLKLR